MKLFEYEAKGILQKYGLAVPRGRIAKSPEEAREIARDLAKTVFLKSQITVSGRGKAGGILTADTPPLAGQIASSLLGKTIKGMAVHSLLVEEKLEIQQQLYTSIAIDRNARTLVALASARGGMDIEEVARISPQKIARFFMDPLSDFSESYALSLVCQLLPEPDDQERWAEILLTLYKIALDCDAELVELNPLIITTSGEWIAADARITLDDNAIFRHPEYTSRSLAREEDTPREAVARKQGFSYVDLDGDTGIIGNGAGLVMATVDLVHLFGGKPANFLDIGGGAQVDVIKNGILLVLSKPEVKGVLVNILGGITRCDMVAEGIVEGLKAANSQKPIAVRMMGTNEVEGQVILRQAGIGYYPDMEQAAQAIILSQEDKT
jgi:succinyl-CoA synthetase beta subunit